MFTDELRHKVWNEIRQRDLRAFAGILSAEVFVEAARIAGVRLGKSALSKVQLVWLGMASALHRTRSFASILSLVFKLLEDAPGRQSVTQPRRSRAGKKKRSQHHPQGHGLAEVSEEAFVQARGRMPLSFWTAILLVLGQRFEEKHGAGVRWKQFRLLALDGTTVNLPAWQRLRTHFGAAQNGKSKGRTQVRMLMLQLPLVRMPWRYTVGPVGTGERTMAGELLGFLRDDDLVLLDRGFWSYGLFHQIQQQQAYFAIRLSAGVRLKSVRRLGPRERLVRWNMPTGPRWRGSGLPAQITLRVVEYQIRGFRPSAVVTNVLDPRTVSREDWVRLASETEAGDERLGVGLYHRRWEIETSFCELKVTQGLEGGLRSRTPAGIYYEIAGHMLLYFLVRWLMVEAAFTAGLDPLRLSFKGALEELCDLRHALLLATPQRVQRVLLPRLLHRISQHLVPFRPGRHFPRPNDPKTKTRGRGKRPIPHKRKQAA